jgi:spermidine synthase
MRPTGYYSHSSGIGKAIASRPHPVRVGVIGLGAGTIAAYARPGDTYDFYEINPLVLDIARSQFEFLARAQGRVNVIMGDARLSLERQSPRRYDVLAVDAFSGDSIPVHLMTVEAFHEYFRHVVADGIVAAHVSNRYLNLIEVVRTIATELHKPALLVTAQRDLTAAATGSIWVLVANDPAWFTRPEWAAVGTLLSRANTKRPWTDDYVNIVGSLGAPTVR